jgi:nucleoside-diphosphate-sugar epimerase
MDYEDFFLTNQIDCILHCATDYGRKKVDPIRTIEANLILPLKLLHAGASNGVSCFINTDSILDKNVSNYSLSKKQFVDWLETYSDRITGINVALEHFYGPDDDPSKFVTYVIDSLLSNVGRLELTLGHQKRDFIYIDDVTQAFMKLIDNVKSFKRGFYRFEVGSGKPVEIRAFIKLAKKLCENEITFLDFGAIPYRKNEVMNSDVDTSGLKKMGWHPLISLEEGLIKTIMMSKG